MMNWIKKESKILAVSLGIGMLLAISVAAITFVYSESTQRNIAENVIRLHVQANSDSVEDQEIKDYVSMSLLSSFGGKLAEKTDIATTRAALAELLPQIQEHAQEIIRAAGFYHTVTAEMGHLFFPTQFYGNLAFPSGIYEAVQVIIGNGEGENWWCLMFPPLCYVDMAATTHGREQLSNTVSAESLRLITHAEEPSTNVVVRFRIVEWWQNRNAPRSPAPAQNQHIVSR